jgi:predicted flavoprotein YhiN
VHLRRGSGRCNFTNVHAKAENFLSENPHFAKSALARFTPTDFVALVEKHGIKYHEKTLGQLFCDDSARQIVTLLEKECAAAGVETRVGVTVGGVRRVEGEGFSVKTSDGRTIDSKDGCDGIGIRSSARVWTCCN